MAWDSKYAYEVPGKLEIPYRYFAGKTGSEFLTTLRDQKKILASKCGSCGGVMVPPRSLCDKCQQPTEGFVEVGPAGVVTACTIIRYPDLHLSAKPPYILANIKLDGADTGMTHIINCPDLKSVKIGTRVEAVWSEDRKARITDISYFTPAASDLTGEIKDRVEAAAKAVDSATRAAIKKVEDVMRDSDQIVKAIEDTARDVQKKARETVKSVDRKARATVKSARQRAGRISEAVKSAPDRAANRARPKLEVVRNKIDETADRARNRIKEVRGKAEPRVASARYQGKKAVDNVKGMATGGKPGATELKAGTVKVTIRSDSSVPKKPQPKPLKKAAKTAKKSVGKVERKAQAVKRAAPKKVKKTAAVAKKKVTNAVKKPVKRIQPKKKSR